MGYVDLGGKADRERSPVKHFFSVRSIGELPSGDAVVVLTQKVQLNVGKAYIGKLSNRQTWAGAAPTPDGGSKFPVTLWGPEGLIASGLAMFLTNRRIVYATR